MLELRLSTVPPDEQRGFDFLNEVPIGCCCVGEDAAVQLADMAAARCGKKAFVLSDRNTRAAAGEAPYEALGRAGKKVTEHVYPADPIDASDKLAADVAVKGMDADFFVAVGSGSICDLAKSAGSSLGKPVLLYGTAASMNGYTSSIVALKVRGLKRTLPCAPALGVFADPRVLATAPQRMTAAGVADFLSKCSSTTDWHAAHHLRGGDYSDRPRRIVDGIQQRIFDQAKNIGRGTPEGAALVMEALLLSGFGMVLAGSSAPASGGEHLISHYVDMKHALYGTPNDLHGTQVGIGTLYALELWEKLLAMDADAIDPASLADRHLSQDAIHKNVLKDWGKKVGKEVWEQWSEKALDRMGLVQEIALFKEKLPMLREALADDLRPAAAVAQCIADSGGPIRAEDTLADPLEFERAKRGARYIRNRFTVLDLAAEAGIAP
ncbi:MAG: iron-containing alcohol dehydrogenase [Candidatus Hydrogenedens sp.]|nr:iron-containing alcohol dehydrogenase [Candidatus Hydrogenedens sp.]